MSRLTFLKSQVCFSSAVYKQRAFSERQEMIHFEEVSRRLESVQSRSILTNLVVKKKWPEKWRGTMRRAGGTHVAAVVDEFER